MALTQLQVIDICQGGSWGSGGLPCKYLDTALRSDKKYVQVCTKLNPGAYADLKKKRWGNGKMGDNCKGYLLLHYKKQGYDV